MGKVESFTILYDRAIDNTVPIYTSGEWVSGRIVVQVNAQIEVKALKIHAKGQAYVHWTEGNSMDSDSRSYYEQNRYLKYKNLLIGECFPALQRDLSI
ncbi:arrestin domain-containing protein 3-like [Carcharodon carcharias]|uniref:arrestin domain-containing protein 3-like n=1 Tax=Carcharodon carcharias TaxID=13397 RepID=UPI001B7EB94D|nr:arrestin domain-containing protein 3-like [Carcharodon carcharias]